MGDPNACFLLVFNFQTLAVLPSIIAIFTIGGKRT
jgi:hypothetical protein